VSYLKTAAFAGGKRRQGRPHWIGRHYRRRWRRPRETLASHFIDQFAVNLTCVFPVRPLCWPPVCKACGEFDDGILKVTVSSVRIDATGKATIDWSDTLNGTARSKGSTVTLPAALNVANSYLIWSEVQYSYKPVIGYVVSGTLTLKDQIYMRPRLSDSVTRDT
jgi:hypothetical protein